MATYIYVYTSVIGSDPEIKLRVRNKLEPSVCEYGLLHHLCHIGVTTKSRNGHLKFMKCLEQTLRGSNWSRPNQGRVFPAVSQLENHLSERGMTHHVQAKTAGPTKKLTMSPAARPSAALSCAKPSSGKLVTSCSRTFCSSLYRRLLTKATIDVSNIVSLLFPDCKREEKMPRHDGVCVVKLSLDPRTGMLLETGLAPFSNPPYDA